MPRHVSLTTVCLCICLATPPATAQITSIPAMTVPGTQMDFEMLPLGAVTLTDINLFYGTSIANILPVMPLAGDGTYNTTTALGRALGLEPGSTGNLWIVDPPSGTFGGGNGYRIELGQPSTQFGVYLGDWCCCCKDVTFYDGATMVGMSTCDPSLAVVQFYESAVPFDTVEITGAPNYVIPEMWVESGLGCSIVTPASPAMGDVTIDIDVRGAMSPTVDIALDYSLDGGSTWLPCTAAATSPLSNPAFAVPAGMATFLWDTVADMVGTSLPQPGVLVRGTVVDALAPMPGTCQTAAFDVDNVIPPSCTLAGPTGTAGGSIQLDIDAQTPNGPTVDITIEYSLDTGVTWNLCAASGTSPLLNPAIATPTGMSVFLWDSLADAVGTTMLVPSVQVRATVDDGVVVPTGVCSALPFDVDNTSLCGGICGDCNVNGLGPDIVDALTAAQIAVTLVVPTMTQMGCCDVNSTMTVDVVDALGIAQGAAGLPVTLTCP